MGETQIEKVTRKGRDAVRRKAKEGGGQIGGFGSWRCFMWLGAQGKDSSYSGGSEWVGVHLVSVTWSRKF